MVERGSVVAHPPKLAPTKVLLGWRRTVPKLRQARARASMDLCGGMTSGCGYCRTHVLWLMHRFMYCMHRI
eukprot:COSAG06_NODE_61698_length_267_cov_0.601190_1_plen_70_part_01